MGKFFNVNAACNPDLHYMVDITDKLTQYIFAGVCKNLSEGSAETGMLNEYEAGDENIDVALMFGFAKVGNSGFVTVANRILKCVYTIFFWRKKEPETVKFIKRRKRAGTCLFRMAV